MYAGEGLDSTVSNFFRFGPDAWTGGKFDSLKQLLGCYFHQDSPAEFEDDLAAVRAMLANESDEQIAKGILPIGSVLHAELNEDQLETMLTDQMGCYFEPASAGLNRAQWLYRLRSTLQGSE
jgi:hypothetical protein